MVKFDQTDFDRIKVASSKPTQAMLRTLQACVEGGKYEFENIDELVKIHIELWGGVNGITKSGARWTIDNMIKIGYLHPTGRKDMVNRPLAVDTGKINIDLPIIETKNIVRMTFVTWVGVALSVFCILLLPAHAIYFIISGIAFSMFLVGLYFAQFLIYGEEGVRLVIQDIKKPFVWFLISAENFLKRTKCFIHSTILK